MFVYLDAQPTLLVGDNGAVTTASTTLDLPLMAMQPVGARGKAAIIGFIPSKFVVAPAPSNPPQVPVPFKIVSTSNDLIILDTSDYPASPGSGAGFMALETKLTAVFSATCTSLRMTLYFKIVDVVSDYTLFMKHWKTGAQGVQLSMVINADTANPIEKYVDAMEAEGGESNLTTITLRNQDYASIDYHDYLQLGLNSIDITITPIGNAYVADSNYAIRAVSIERV